MLSRLRKKVQKQHKHDIAVCPEDAASEADGESEAAGGKRVFHLLKSMSSGGGSRKKSNAAISLGKFQLDGTECRAIREKPDHNSPSLPVVLSPGQVVSASEIQNGWMRLSDGWTEMTPLIIPVRSSSPLCPPLLLKTATEYFLYYNEYELCEVDRDLKSAIEQLTVSVWFSELVSQHGPWPPPGYSDLISELEAYNYVVAAYGVLLLKAGILSVPCTDESKLIQAGLPPRIISLLSEESGEVPEQARKESLALDDILALPNANDADTLDAIFGLPPASVPPNPVVQPSVVDPSTDSRTDLSRTPNQVLTPPYPDTRDSTFSDFSPQSIRSDPVSRSDVLSTIAMRSDLKDYLSKELTCHCDELLEIGYTAERLRAEGISGDDPKIADIVSAHEQASPPLWNALSSSQEPPSRKIYIIKTQKSPQGSVAGIQISSKQTITGVIENSDAHVNGITSSFIGKKVTSVVDTEYVAMLIIQNNVPPQQCDLPVPKQSTDKSSLASRLFKRRGSANAKATSESPIDNSIFFQDQCSSTSVCTPQQAIIRIDTGTRSRSNSVAQSVASEGQESCLSIGYGALSPKQVFTVGQRVLYSPSQALTPASNCSPVQFQEPCWVQGEIISTTGTDSEKHHCVRVLATDEILKGVPESWIQTAPPTDSPSSSDNKRVMVSISEYCEFITGEIDGVSNSGVYTIKVLGSDSETCQLTADHIRRARSDSTVSDISLVRQATFSPKSNLTTPFPSSGALRRPSTESEPQPQFTVGQNVIFNTTANGCLAGTIAAVHQNTYDIAPKKNAKKVLYQHWRPHNIKAALSPGDSVSYNTSSGWADGGEVVQFSNSSGHPLYTIKTSNGKLSKSWKHSNLRKVEKITWTHEQNAELQEVKEKLQNGEVTDELTSRKQQLERAYNLFIEQGLISMRKSDAVGTPNGKQSAPKVKKSAQLLGRLSPWSNRKYDARDVSLNTGISQSRGMTQTLRTTLPKRPPNLTTERGGRTVQEISFLGNIQWWLLHNETVTSQHPEDTTCPLTNPKLQASRYQCRLTHHKSNNNDDDDDDASSVSSCTSACNLTRDELVQKADSILEKTLCPQRTQPTHHNLRNLYASCKQRVVDRGGASCMSDVFPVTKKLLALSQVAPPDPEDFASYSTSLSFVKEKPPLPMYPFNDLLLKATEKGSGLSYAALLKKAELPKTSLEFEKQYHIRARREARMRS